MRTSQEIEILVIESIQQLAEDFNLISLKKAGSKSSLYGGDGALDSMALVNLIADVEDAVLDQFGVAITLADEKAMSMHNSPFLNVETLTQAVLERMPT